MKWNLELIWQPTLCMRWLYRFTLSECVCLLRLHYASSSALVIKPGPPCSSKKRKRKSESCILYKLSAVKEGAKIKTINTVHNYVYLLRQPSVTSAMETSNTSPDFSPDRKLNKLKYHGKRNLFGSLNVKTLTHTRFHTVIVMRNGSNAAFSVSSGTPLHLCSYHLKLAAKLNKKKMWLSVGKHTFMFFINVFWCSKWRLCIYVCERMHVIIVLLDTLALYCT